MVLKRGSNTGNHQGVTGVVPSVYDLAALDDLGPRTRSAIVNGPLKTLAYPVLKQIMDRNDKIEEQNKARELDGLEPYPYLDPQNDARLDELIAKSVLQFQFELMAKDRELEFAMDGVIPLRPRPSPKSVREQRRAMRGARRWR